MMQKLEQFHCDPAYYDALKHLGRRVMDRHDHELAASDYEGALTATKFSEPGGGRASDYDWQLIDLPLASFGSQEQWIDWFNEWKPIYIKDLGYDRLGEMVEYLKANPDDPIIAVRWIDKQFYLWDGCHRVAASYFLNRTTITTILGTPKE